MIQLPKPSFEKEDTIKFEEKFILHHSLRITDAITLEFFDIDKHSELEDAFWDKLPDSLYSYLNVNGKKYIINQLFAPAGFPTNYNLISISSFAWEGNNFIYLKLGQMGTLIPSPYFKGILLLDNNPIVLPGYLCGLSDVCLGKVKGVEGLSYLHLDCMGQEKAQLYQLENLSFKKVSNCYLYLLSSTEFYHIDWSNSKWQP